MVGTYARERSSLHRRSTHTHTRTHTSKAPAQALNPDYTQLRPETFHIKFVAFISTHHTTPNGVHNTRTSTYNGSFKYTSTSVDLYSVHTCCCCCCRRFFFVGERYSENMRYLVISFHGNLFFEFWNISDFHFTVQPASCNEHVCVCARANV